MSKKKDFIPRYVAFSNYTNLVKVGCSYAGKMYYGIAKCAPEDEFNFEFGYRLAKARCDYAICTAKMKRSQEKLDMYRYYAEMLLTFVEDEEEYEKKLHEQWLKAGEELTKAQL